MSNIEYRNVKTPELRVEAQDEGLPVIRGYASVFNSPSEDLGGFREIIKPGAFKAVLDNDVRALIDHDSAKVLGRTSAGTLTLQEDEKGLYCEISPPDTTYSRDLLVSIKRGDISQMSFGFQVGEEDWSDEEGSVRYVNSVSRLVDVSCVTYPAYPETSVAVRSLQQWKAVARKRNHERVKRIMMFLDM